MREVITVGVGQAGIHMVDKYCDSVREDHDLDPIGTYKG